MAWMTRRATLLAVPFAALPLHHAKAQPAPLVVFAAGTVQDALRELEPSWRDVGGPPLRFSFAASSALVRQLGQEAQADLILSADEAWMGHAERTGDVARDARRTVLTTDLVLVAPASVQPFPARIVLDPAAPGGATGLAALLGPRGRWTTGDPAHTPIGRYAEAALRSLGQWEALLPRMARGNTARAALVLVERGEAIFGVVSRSDVAASQAVREEAVFAPTTHPPVCLAFGLTPRGAADPRARALLDFLASPAAAPIWRRHGFTPVGAPA
ncbi:MAG: molybdate ABC transporter substrate-binding protein [Acetobacteraceae bacterium]|nr:molybdate ABC transporter substrate-binding protein [Acetobacteraceae bacterium]